jgi:hypothetical protein
MPHTPDPSPSAERGEKSPWAAGTVMILIDLLPPGLTFQDLVGPADATHPPATTLAIELVSQVSGPSPDGCMRRMRLIADHELLQRYMISAPDVSAEHADGDAAQIEIARSVDLTLTAAAELA